MSRSPEEQLLLDQRIEAMKRKNEELRRRHLEVEADKQSAAKQNALVQTKTNFDDEWVPGRHHDRSPPHQSNQDRQDPKSQRTEYQRGGHQNDRHSEDTPPPRSGYHSYESQPQSYRRNQYEESQSRGKHSNFNRGRRNDFQNRRVSNEDWGSGDENRRPVDYSGHSREISRNRPKDWGTDNRQWQHQARREDAPNSREPTTSYSTGPSVTSKVFKNSSFDNEKGRKPKPRLGDGDGPPADPSYSFLGDDERDPPDVVDKRQSVNRRGFHRGQDYNRGGRSWNNRRYEDSREGDDGSPRNPSYEAWRKERNKIDEDRINRQKTSDGNWSREWDNNKLYQEEHDQSYGRRGNRGFRHGTHGNRGGRSTGTPDPAPATAPATAPAIATAPAGVAQMRMNRMREGHFPGEQGFHVDAHYSAPCHDQIRRGRFGPRRGRTQSTESPSSHENKPEKQSQGSVLPEEKSCNQTVSSVVADSADIFVEQSVESSFSNLDSAPIQRRHRVKTKKERNLRMSSKTSSLTAKLNDTDEDGSWEDVTSEEETSEVTELRRSFKVECSTSKSLDTSSGPESLDPVPTSGKEDGFLWDDYHTGGFQDNVSVDLNAQEVCQALLRKETKDGDEGLPCPSFRLDTHCLEDSDGEGANPKIDPLLVTTRIVQAEVEQMSLQSTHSDESLPMDKTMPEADSEVQTKPHLDCDSGQERKTFAEEISGPLSILDVQSTQTTSSDSENSFQSVESPETPKKELPRADEQTAADKSQSQEENDYSSNILPTTASDQVSKPQEPDHNVHIDTGNLELVASLSSKFDVEDLSHAHDNSQLIETEKSDSLTVGKDSENKVDKAEEFQVNAADITSLELTESNNLSHPQCQSSGSDLGTNLLEGAFSEHTEIKSDSVRETDVTVDGKVPSSADVKCEVKADGVHEACTVDVSENARDKALSSQNGVGVVDVGYKPNMDGTEPVASLSSEFDDKSKTSVDVLENPDTRQI